MENLEIEKQVFALKLAGTHKFHKSDIEAFQAKLGDDSVGGLEFAFQAIMASPGLTLEQAFNYSLNQLKIT